jgi:ATP-binding cassette, subfamily B, bacterial
MSMQGVAGEDRIELNKDESKAVRLRSRRLLGSLVRPIRSRLAVSITLVVISQAARAIGPAMIAFGIDRALPEAIHQNLTPLFWVVAAYLGAALTAATLTYAFLKFAARTNQNVLFDLRQRLFVHAQRLSLEFHETYTSGRVIARQTSDLDAIKELLDTGGNEMIAGALYMIFTSAALYALDPSSFVVLLFSLVPLGFLTRWFQRNTKLRYRETRVASARLIVKFVETMTGIRAVKAFRKEKANDAEYAQLTEDYRKVNAKVIQLFGIYDPGLTMIGTVTVAAILLFGGFRVIDGHLGIGILTAAILYARRFFDPMEGMATFYNAYQSATSALEKISGVLEEVESVPEPQHPVKLEHPAGHLNFKDVEFHYSNGKTVLPGFNLDIPAGQTIALVGTTGAGKSTLAKLVSRLYDPSVGQLTLDGVNLRDLSNLELRKAIVMVTQEAYLFSGTVADNIALGKPDATSAEIQAAAKAVGVHEFIMSMPQGYDTDVNKRGGRVSAGQRQLISFARAFIADPAVLILDEATASLDIPSERLVQHALKTLLDGRTSIIIAHRLSTVSIADRVLVMEHGQIIEDDTPAALISGTGKFSRMHAAWRASLV